MIRGDHVVLSEVRPDDLETLFSWINDAETVRFNAPYRPISWLAHMQWYERLASDASRVLLIIRREDDGPPLGVVQLLDIHPVHRSAELTTRIGSEENRSQGFGTRAIAAALDFARRDLNLKRVWLRVFTDNKRAIRSYEKAGLIHEGVMRCSAWIDGKWKDQAILAKIFE